MSQMGWAMTTWQLFELMGQLDADLSGQINFHEFARGLARLTSEVR